MAMTMGFMPILQPTNPESYDPLVFYNVALPIVIGMGTAALSFRLLPPLSPAYRARRLLSLTLRDLRRLAKVGKDDNWEDRVVARLSVLPGEATPPQRTDLLAALAVGNEIIRLRQIADQLEIGADLDVALALLARGDSSGAITQFNRIEERLAIPGVASAGEQSVMRARGAILAISEVLIRHPAYFNDGRSG